MKKKIGYTFPIKEESIKKESSKKYVSVLKEVNQVKNEMQCQAQILRMRLKSCSTKIASLYGPWFAEHYIIFTSNLQLFHETDYNLLFKSFGASFWIWPQSEQYLLQHRIWMFLVVLYKIVMAFFELLTEWRIIPEKD